MELATAFAQKYRVFGIDINFGRNKELKKGIEITREISSEKLQKALVQKEEIWC